MASHRADSAWKGYTSGKFDAAIKRGTGMDGWMAGWMGGSEGVEGVRLSLGSAA
jgi:hypothetical protein